ncbi:MAG: cytochrome b561 domain-containing protein [Pseudomonadota bacterium]
MLEWLVHPIDPTRAHEVGVLLSWHGRLMVVAWGFCVPIGILAARFFKVLPWQDWPKEVDNHVWWNTHRLAQYTALALMGVGLVLVLSEDGHAASITPTVWLHRVLGYATLLFGVGQLMSGWLRGSKGGPTDPGGHMRGDHYDMTPRRLLFERYHKTVGYVALSAAAATILSGLWQANAPRWMWICLLGWWVFIAVVAVALKSRGPTVSTYAAIWGPDPIHPGNRPASDEGGPFDTAGTAVHRR